MENPYLSMLWSALSQSAPLLLLLLVFVIAVKVLEAKFGRKKRGRWQRSSRWDASGRDKVLPFQPPRDKILDAADQLRTVMRADFKAQPLLNKSEARLFKMIDKWVIELRPG